MVSGVANFLMLLKVFFFGASFYFMSKMMYVDYFFIPVDFGGESESNKILSPCAPICSSNQIGFTVVITANKVLYLVLVLFDSF